MKVVGTHYIKGSLPYPVRKRRAPYFSGTAGEAATESRIKLCFATRQKRCI